MKTLTLKYRHVVGASIYGPGEVIVGDSLATVLVKKETLREKNLAKQADALESNDDEDVINDN